VSISDAEPASVLVGVTDVSDGEGFGVGDGVGVDEETAPQPLNNKSAENSRALCKFVVYVHNRSHPRIMVASEFATSREIRGAHSIERLL
jgi:hypothetical protein